MNHRKSTTLLPLVCTLVFSAMAVDAGAAERIHCVTDISHTFSFYFDGRFNGAKRHDPNMDKLDIAHGSDVPHVVHMAKPMWIFEQLRKEKPDIVARYFKTKRKLATPKTIKKYTADDSIVVLSIAMGRNLFPWMQSLGVTVDSSQSQLATQDAFQALGE